MIFKFLIRFVFFFYFKIWNISVRPYRMIIDISLLKFMIIKKNWKNDKNKIEKIETINF